MLAKQELCCTPAPVILMDHLVGAILFSVHVENSSWDKQHLINYNNMFGCMVKALLSNFATEESSHMLKLFFITPAKVPGH